MSIAMILQLMKSKAPAKDLAKAAHQVGLTGIFTNKGEAEASKSPFAFGF